jgi:hypothetical protein
MVVSPVGLRETHAVVLERRRGPDPPGPSGWFFRRDLPRRWLVTAIYSLVHAAADDVDAGRLPAGRAAGVLEKTVLWIVRVGPGV